MKQKNLIVQWLERVDYDLSAAESMLKSGHFLYVAFLCQQAVEKTLKALWCTAREDSPPYTHNLEVLSESLNLKLSDENQTFLELLNQFYIVGRYPSFKQKLALDLDRKKASDMIQKSKEFVQWCKQSMKM